MHRPATLCLFLVALGASASRGQAVHKARVFGEGNLDKFGAAVIAVGDLNSDGFEELAVGAPEADPPGMNDAGIVYILSGADPQIEWGRIEGATAGEKFGSSLVPLGDVNNDSVPDFAVGSPEFDDVDTHQGKVSIISGATLTVMVDYTRSGASNLLGFEMSCAGDLDQDGVTDLLVGVPGDLLQKGSAVLLTVTASAVTEIHRFEGTVAAEHLGNDVAIMDDITGDSRPEFIIASPDWNGFGIATGRVQVFSGDPDIVDPYPLIRELTGSESFARFGFQVDQIADPDGTGDAHLLVSVLGRENGPTVQSAGGFSVFDVLTGLEVRHYAGSQANMFLGLSLAQVSDQDGDDIEDVLIGSPLDSNGVALAGGVVELVSGATGGLLYRVRGNEDLERCGESVADLPDLDGDGFSEYVWTYSSDENATGDASGSVEIVRGRTPRLQTDKEAYDAQEQMELSGIGYANRAMFVMIGTGSSGAAGPYRVAFNLPWAIIPGFVTGSDGSFLLTTGLPDINLKEYELFFQAFVANPAGGSFLFSELANVLVRGRTLPIDLPITKSKY